jgi:hypothetical protein
LKTVAVATGLTGAASPVRCIHGTPETSWAAGDATDPLAGELLADVVTAVCPDGEESSSGDPPRTLADPCPAP